MEGRVSNSVGRGAVENMIKNSVYNKYNIDSQTMKEFSRLSPTEMISSFGESIKELGTLRHDYSEGKYSKEEFSALNSKIKGEISGKMLEMGSSRKSILEDILLRSFGISPGDVSKVKTFGDLVELFKPDGEPEMDADARLDMEPDPEIDTDFADEEITPDTDMENADLHEADVEAESQIENDAEQDNEEQSKDSEPDSERKTDEETDSDA
ncbi:MAG TPA: hypothetical protein DEB10_15395, partial [Ruminococcaceae bacterium]|nr:hypothetical protein [Oscillospiraceae bacterium]